MNILHVGYIENRPQSGVANVVPKYLEYQAKHARVALLNFCNFTPPNAESNYSIFHWSGTESDISSLGEPFSQPDLVVFHEVYRPQFIKLAKSLRSRKIPYIVIPHVSLTDTAQSQKRVKKLLGNWLLFNTFIRGAVAIQYLSESEKEQSNKFKHLPHFIRSNGLEIRGRRKKHFNADKLELIYVGRLEFEVKGIDRILEAASLIKDQMIQRNIRITLLGTAVGNNLEKIQAFIERQSLEEIVHVGNGVFGDEKIAKILANDCFIQLSRTEGQPLGIMEAMDLGMPCIVTSGTTFREIAHEKKVGIPVEDMPNKIAETIINIRAGAYDLPRLSKKASSYAAATFEWDKVSKLMIDDYRKIIAEK